jgi:hypothetical protein
MVAVGVMVGVDVGGSGVEVATAGIGVADWQADMTSMMTNSVVNV